MCLENGDDRKDPCRARVECKDECKEKCAWRHLHGGDDCKDPWCVKLEANVKMNAEKKCAWRMETDRKDPCRT